MNHERRFSNKGEVYNRFRPEYPAAIIQEISTLSGLTFGTDLIVADLGAGTGKFTKLLCNSGVTVFAIEPEPAMREVMDAQLSACSNFNSLNATAEHTGLKTGLVDLITAAQAFHYFDLKLAKKEFERILKPNGCVILLWMFRNTDSLIMSEYNDIVYQYCSSQFKPTRAREKMNDTVFETFFECYETHNLFYTQDLSFDEMWGRILSSNHAPAKDEPQYLQLYFAALDLFHRYKSCDKIRLSYRLQITIGRL